MADTTVEIFNNTLPFANYVNNTQTLVTTDAATRYVIKDVQLDSNGYSSSNTPYLSINNTKVATLNSNLSGSEIMDVNSSLTISLPDANGTFFTLNGMLSGTSVYQGLSTNSNADAYFSGNLAAAADATNSATTLTTVLTGGSSARICWFIGSDFYYYYTDGNSTTQFFRRVGGVNGTEQTINSNSYSPVCFDGVSKFYWFNSSGTLYAYNTTTNTTITNIGYSAASGSTYPVLAFCNGFLFWSPTYSNNQIYWYHIATGNNGSVSAVNNSSSVGWVAFYDSSASSYQYRIVCLPVNGNYSTSMYFTDLTVNSTGDRITGSTYGTFSPPNGFSWSGSMSSTGTKYAIMCGSSSSFSSIYIIDKGFNIISSKPISIVGSYGFNSYVSTPVLVTSPTTAQKNALGPTAKLRITGIKQT